MMEQSLPDLERRRRVCPYTQLNQVAEGLHPQSYSDMDQPLDWRPMNNLLAAPFQN